MAPPRPYINRLSGLNRLKRGLWNVVWVLLYRPSPALLHAWRRQLLRCFGAKIGPNALPYPRCRIWAPWNLTMDTWSCLANDVDCYSAGPIRLGEGCTVSQYAFLCTATHDYESADFHLVTEPIVIGPRAWVAARAFVGPGVTVGEGAVVGANASVYKDVEPWTVVGGNPARILKRRVVSK